MKRLAGCGKTPVSRRLLVVCAVLLTTLWASWVLGQGSSPAPVNVPIVAPPIPKLPLTGPPPGWELKEFTGKAEIAVRQDGEHIVVHLTSRGTSFALFRDVPLDITRYPILKWSWKVTELPAGGDIRQKTTDDQAAQLYVVFPRGLVHAVQSHLLGYLWDTTAPVGTKVSSPQPCPPTCNTKVIVLQSGAQKLGQWVEERRNILEDYRALFGQEPPKVGRVAVMIDSNDTKGKAESFFRELVFFPAGAAAGQ